MRNLTETNLSDAVFGVRESQVVAFVWNHSQEEAVRSGVFLPFSTVDYDSVLEPA